LIPSPEIMEDTKNPISSREIKVDLPPQPKWEDGAEVFVGAAKRRGTLVHKEKNGVWSVQFGGIRMSVKEKNMTLVPIGELRPSVTKPSIVLETVEGDTVKGKPAFELRLLGMRYEDAIKALERQLDLCAITNFKSFSIIHGKGNGILQQGVQQYLSQYPGIKEFHFAQPEDGGTGKTYVTLI
ncbi:MAG: Smr/MutS family protein, partial [Treponema sp.]|nr:Smr/MutS family protein [Treponema sp.]